MKTVRYVCLFAAAMVLASCVGYDLQRLNNTTVSGDSFTDVLAREYRDLANFEANRMRDWHSAERFAQKGLAAAAGEAVEPFSLADFNLPADSLPELTDARARLMTVLEASARQSAPLEAATAQAKFDCWVEQRSEGVNPDHIATCRDEFFAALALLEGTRAPAGPVYFVFFDFDRSVITPAGQQVIDSVIRDHQAGGSISVVGHTDRAGSAAYNLRLSQRRAEAVRQALIRGGVSASVIQTSWQGEENPLVPTPDGVREPSNRRAEIRFQ